jgi:hypothetical protein
VHQRGLEAHPAAGERQAEVVAVKSGVRTATKSTRCWKKIIVFRFYPCLWFYVFYNDRE